MDGPCPASDNHGNDSTGKQMDQRLDRILAPNEKVAWRGVVNRRVLVTLLVISLMVLLFIGGIVSAQQTLHYTSNGQPKQISGPVVGIAIIVIGLLIVSLSFFSDMVKAYAITQKRVVIKSGLIGTDFKSIPFDQIKNVVVDVGLIGKIFHVGSVKIDIGKTKTYSSGVDSGRRHGPGMGTIRTKTMYDVLKHIDQPYDVYTHLHRVLEGRKESLYSGRADRESNPKAYA